MAVAQLPVLSTAPGEEASVRRQRRAMVIATSDLQRGASHLTVIDQGNAHLEHKASPVAPGPSHNRATEANNSQKITTAPEYKHPFKMPHVADGGLAVKTLINTTSLTVKQSRNRTPD